MSNANIACRLEEQVDQQAHKRAVIELHKRDENSGGGIYKHLTFLQLEELSSKYARAFAESGITKGSRVLLGVKPGADLCALTFALFKVGAVPVFIDPGMGPKHLLNCVEQAKAEAIVGLPAVFVFKLFNCKAFEGVKIKWSLGFCPIIGVKNLKSVSFQEKFYPACQMEQSDVAALLFTSGSTGPAKGVVYTCKIFNFQLDIIKEQYEVATTDMDMSVFPLFALFAVCMGMPTVIPDMDTSKPAAADPEKILQIMEEQDVSFSFGSPAFWKVMADYCEENNHKLNSVRCLVMAGCSVEPDLHRRYLNNILKEGAEIYVPYGATESLPLTSMKGSEVLSFSAERSEAGDGTCVGKPMSGEYDVKIIKISDDAVEEWSNDIVLKPGEVGEIVNSGPITTHEYYNNSKGTKKSKIYDGDKIWHRMGDLGYFDEQGYLWFCGRKNERVEIEQELLCTDKIENVLNLHKNVKRSALVPLNEKEAALIVEPNCEKLLESQDRQKVAIQEFVDLLKQKLPNLKIDKFLFKADFPVDVRHNAKIKRDLLREWAQKEI
ncbi:peptide synthase [Lentisphaera araneosa HTCC2155]|uniref:Peptide synthase n=1 Tax=Lentisphaera araneosa HTCC2155 TaxID=313628 RepID=A6DTG5_9BACT|nr:fatty acid CoA ligase family protein [Lentisphaera araneosa]EDM25069.1 peptide synthase [Lentisphaera araneosa HTCC2155]